MDLETLIDLDSNAIDDVLRKQVEKMDRNARTDLPREAQLWANAPGGWRADHDPQEEADDGG